MINLELKQNASAENVFDKTLTDVETVSGVLKEKTDIVNPTFILDLKTPPAFNYVVCGDFNRCYFVRGISSINGLWEISCECDVLSSFKSEIRENYAIVRRQENNYNLLYNDGSFRCYQDPHIISKAFPNGFNPSTPSFVLAVAGGVEDIDT